MAKKHRRKRSILRSRFYQIYFLLVLICVAAIALGMRALNDVLADYESAQPVHVAEATARLFEAGDYETLYTLDASMQAISGGDSAFYIQSMRELAGGKAVSWSEAYSPSEDERRYNVYLDGERFAEFTLVPSGAQTARGNRLWTLGSLSTCVTVQAAPEPEVELPSLPEVESIPCTITVPSDYTVMVNGARLGANDVVQGDIATASAGLLPEGVPSPTLIRYAFLSETDAPELSVTDVAGNVQTLAQDGACAWSCPLPENPELKAQYEEGVIDVAKRIASYLAKDLKKGAVLKYCARNSPAYESIDNFDNTWGTPHKGATFENIVTSDYRLYSESCFSCHVEFDYVARYSKDDIRTFPTAYTLYFIREGSKGRLYSFTLY